MPRSPARVLVLLLPLVAACGARPVVIAPGAVPAPVCPLEGCGQEKVRAIESAGPVSACPAAGEAPCAGASAMECTERALAAWSEASDEHAVACVAQTLAEACSLGEARACGFAGRLWVEGRGVPRDAHQGMEMLARSCDDGIELSCRAAIRWLADADHARAAGDNAGELRARLDTEGDCLAGVADQCFAVGLSYYAGRAGFARDPARSAVAYGRGCDLGQRIACNNLGDAYEYGTGVRRDLSRAAALYDRACRLGESLGCANLGHLVENGEGVARDVPRARTLYRDACVSGSVYGCLHAMMAAIDTPRTAADAARSVVRWERACAGRDARACAFVGLMYEDGPDGFARDEKKSQDAMTRGCKLGEPRACEWLQSHPL